MTKLTYRVQVQLLQTRQNQEVVEVGTQLTSRAMEQLGRGQPCPVHVEVWDCMDWDPLDAGEAWWGP